MVGHTEFAKLVPGFEFLQGLMKQAGPSLPDMGQWIAPTLDPEELGKRIEQLKTVQFWLEQNTRMIQTSIQALEVQRMTLSTLKGMDLPVQDLMNAFTLQPQAAAAGARDPKEAPPAAGPGAAASAAEPAAAKGRSARSKRPSGAPAAGAGVVDPMKWWGALTEQFTQLAAQALKDAPASPGTARAKAKGASGSGGSGAPRRTARARQASRPAA